MSIPRLAGMLAYVSKRRNSKVFSQQTTPWRGQIRDGILLCRWYFKTELNINKGKSLCANERIEELPAAAAPSPALRAHGVNLGDKALADNSANTNRDRRRTNCTNCSWTSWRTFITASSN